MRGGELSSDVPGVRDHGLLQVVHGASAYTCPSLFSPSRSEDQGLAMVSA
jgi:hypothetical protein